MFRLTRKPSIQRLLVHFLPAFFLSLLLGSFKLTTPQSFSLVCICTCTPRHNGASNLHPSGSKCLGQYVPKKDHPTFLCLPIIQQTAFNNNPPSPAIGTILWCVQLLPQIWTNWRTRSTHGLPGSMMFLWALCGVPFGAYGIVQNFNIPIQVQPQCFMALCLVSWAQTLVYGRGWRAYSAAAAAIVVAAVFGGVEAALILTIRVSCLCIFSFFL